MDPVALRQRFPARFGRPAEHTVRAPGRVNLIGEHTDYNDGFVLPIAIERHVAACLARRNDHRLILFSQQMASSAAIDLDGPISPGEPAWANYCRGVAAGLLDRGVDLCGADVLFDSDIPMGAGLSSSAALEVCTAIALLRAAEKADAIPPRELAVLCQQAEHRYAGAPCGIMDQSICLLAQAGHALLLDCRTGQTTQVPFADNGMVLLVVDTRVRHDIAEGGYGARRRECESAAAKLHLPALRDADEAMVQSAGLAGRLEPKELMRARHVVGEISRTLSAVEAMKGGDYAGFGRLMCESHRSLKNDFEVSCDELDAVVELALACRGFFGARMTGGGFGGSAIVLAKADQADAIAGNITAGFTKRFGHPCGIFATRAAAGAGVIG